jgi:hypothetical protein
MSQEVIKTDTGVARWDELRAVGKFDDRTARMSMQYGTAYVDKPAPTSMEMIANNQHRLLTLSQISQYQGVEFSRVLTMKCINKCLGAYVNVIRGMDRDMLKETADLIVRHHKYQRLTPADIKLCIVQGVCGEFGPILDRVDGALLLSWVSEYYNRKKHLMRSVGGQEEEPAPVPCPENIAQELNKKWTAVLKKDDEQMRKAVRERAR